MKTKNKIFVTIFIFAVLMLLSCVFANQANAATYSELQSKFPNGTYWNHYSSTGNNPDGYTTEPCTNVGNGYHSGDPDCNYYRGWQCAGFAYKLFYDYYGTDALDAYTSADLSTLKAGDVLRYFSSDVDSSNGHTVWVTAVNGDTIECAECNYDGVCGIRWGRTFSKSSITSCTIYVASSTLVKNTDTTAPTITEAFIDMSTWTSTSFTVKAKVSDNVGVTSVLFPTWSVENDQDDIVWGEGTYNSSTGYWEYTVKKSAHNSETGVYATHIYAYDAAGNVTCVGLSDYYFGGTIQKNLGNFTARIVSTGDSNYVLGISGTSSGSSVVLKAKSQSTASQIWVFTKNSDNTYTITNKSTGYVLDISGASDDNGTTVQIHTSNSTDAQKFYIMSYNGYYRLVPASSNDLKAVDIYGANYTANATVDLYYVYTTTNAAQTFKFEKVVTSISLSATSASLTEGDTKTLTVTYSPSTAYYKKVTWKSSDTSVATVSSSGVVTAVSAGTATITATTADGGSVKATCKVTVTGKTPFTDVSSSGYYYDALVYCYENNIISGETSTTFEPSKEITRGQLVTILWRMEGSPTVSTKNKFSDVGSGAYYYEAVRWAASKSIVSGYGDGTFGPGDSVTRQQLAVILRNYAIYKGKTTSSTASLSSFSDSAEVASWAKTAVQWAVGNKIISGSTSGSKTYLNPTDAATRAQATTMIYTYIQNI